MTSTNRTRSIRSTSRRIVGALSTAAAVAVIGVTAVSPQTAAAAGVATGHRYAVGRASAVDPAAIPATSGTTSGTYTLTYRWGSSDRPSRGQPAHSTHPGSA